MKPFLLCTAILLILAFASAAVVAEDENRLFIPSVYGRAANVAAPTPAVTLTPQFTPAATPTATPTSGGGGTCPDPELIDCSNPDYADCLICQRTRTPTPTPTPGGTIPLGVTP